MAKRHPGLPRPDAVLIRKAWLLEGLRELDKSDSARNRVLLLEQEFRKKISSHVGSSPMPDAQFERFNTSPFVLMIHCLKRQYERISQLESDILPAKEFSSMETSAGRMVEAVVLPVYGWDAVPSKMQTPNSALDGKRVAEGQLKLVTLKSGPSCLNDEMSENFADSIISHCRSWADAAGVQQIDFTYGVLYGTPKQSNKKDWHILRNVAQKLASEFITVSPVNRWSCSFKKDGVAVDVSIRIGRDWWTYLGGKWCLVELCVALIRACVLPGQVDPIGQPYTIADLAEIVSMRSVPPEFNVSILQRSQIPWLFFLARHFCDVMPEA